MSFNDYIYWQTIQETGKTPEEIYEYEHPEVVRCKECRWFDKGENDACSWSQCTRHFCQYFGVSENDFCSYGEREGE